MVGTVGVSCPQVPGGQVLTPAPSVSSVSSTYHLQPGLRTGWPSGLPGLGCHSLPLPPRLRIDVGRTV